MTFVCAWCGVYDREEVTDGVNAYTVCRRCGRSELVLVDREARPQEVPTPWELHVDWMVTHYGRRDPACVYCGEHIWMALQGFLGGGSWTTKQADEGPASSLDQVGQRCSESPDSEHCAMRIGGGCHHDWHKPAHPIHEVRAR